MTQDTKPDPKPATPEDHPAHGIPDGAEDAEPKGLPNSDRHQTETAPKR